MNELKDEINEKVKLMFKIKSNNIKLINLEYLEKQLKTLILGFCDIL